jgi:hypothetical protein
LLNFLAPIDATNTVVLVLANEHDLPRNDDSTRVQGMFRACNVTVTKIGIVQPVKRRATGPGSIPGSARFLSSPQRPDRIWDPPNLLTNGYRGPFPDVKTVGA